MFSGQRGKVLFEPSHSIFYCDENGEMGETVKAAS